MSHCIIIQVADNFPIPSEYGTRHGQNEEYIIVPTHNVTAEDLGYAPGAAYKQYILDKIPNAPNGLISEAQDLVETYGVAGESWTKPINNFEDAL